MKAPLLKTLVRSRLIRIVLVTAVAVVGFGIYAFIELNRPVPELVLLKKSVRPYRILRSDKLYVRVAGNDLARVARVDSKGMLSLLGIAEVKVEGRTVKQAEADIGAAYREKFVIGDAKVSVTVQDYAPREITIGGQVNQPGRYTLNDGVARTLRDVIFTAGGGTEMAKLKGVRLTRIQSDGTLRTTIHDLDPAPHERNLQVYSDTVVMEPDDIVYVPQRIL